jgi:hypothetical protein
MSTSTNLAAEFFVASQLFRLGYTVTLTLGNTKEVDLVVTHPDGRTATIDTKGLKNKTNWPLKAKLIRDTHFFVLVSFRDRFSSLADAPDVFVIPSTQLHTVLAKWAGHEQTCVDYYTVRKKNFKDAWHLLFNESV